MTIPAIPVISPPTRKEILVGEMLENAFAGATTLAARFVVNVARAKALVRRHVAQARDHVINSVSQGEAESAESLAFFEN